MLLPQNFPVCLLVMNLLSVSVNKLLNSLSCTCSGLFPFFPQSMILLLMHFLYLNLIIHLLLLFLLTGIFLSLLVSGNYTLYPVLDFLDLLSLNPLINLLPVSISCSCNGLCLVMVIHPRLLSGIFLPFYISYMLLPFCLLVMFLDVVINIYQVVLLSSRTLPLLVVLFLFFLLDVLMPHPLFLIQLSRMCLSLLNHILNLLISSLLYLNLLLIPMILLLVLLELF